MKTITEDVKSKQAVVGQATFEQFDSVDEAINFFESKLDAKDRIDHVVDGVMVLAKSGTTEVLELINVAHKNNTKNAVRAEKTRPTSPTKAIKQLLADDSAKAILMQLLADRGIKDVSLDSLVKEVKAASSGGDAAPATT